MFGVLLIYYPLRLVLNKWLPAYHDSLIFMALIFPMSVYEGKMALLINTYLKALRMEKTIFRVNLFVMCCSFIATFITAFWLKNLTLTVLSIVFLLALRSIMAELILSKKITISVKKDISTELMMTFIFITVSWFLPVPLGFTVYFIVYLIYFVKKYTNIKDFKKIIIDL